MQINFNYLNKNLQRRTETMPSGHHDHNNGKVFESLLLKLHQVCELLNISRTSLYKLMKIDPTFPRPKKIVSSLQGGNLFIAEELWAWYRNKFMGE